MAPKTGCADAYYKMWQLSEEELQLNPACSPKCERKVYNGVVDYGSKNGKEEVAIMFLNYPILYLIAAHMGATPDDAFIAERTGFWVLLATPIVVVYEKYAVYDFGGIVGMVGGSLGLFIGFSFMDFMLMLIKMK